MTTSRLQSPRILPADPFDRDLSRKIDAVIIALEAETSEIWRRWLLLRKWWYERQVPAWYPEVQS